MKRIAVYTKNRMLYRRIVLLTRGIAEATLANEYTHADLAIIDRESFPDLNIDGYVLPFSKRGGKISNLTLSHRELLLAVSNAVPSGKKLLTLSEGSREARLGGRIIKLTEVESRLLSVLLSADGYVSRDELLSKVWAAGTDRGVVNVYVHYLREKLESEGDKVIFTSRQMGYMIDERFKEG